MTIRPVLLLPRIPESFKCPKSRQCPIHAWPRCNFVESAKCGLFPEKRSIPYIDRVLSRGIYWDLRPTEKVAFIKSYFNVNTDESEVDVRSQIAHIILARMILSGH